MNTFLLLQAIRNRLMPELENLPLLTRTRDRRDRQSPKTRPVAVSIGRRPPTQPGEDYDAPLIVVQAVSGSVTEDGFERVKWRCASSSGTTNPKARKTICIISSHWCGVSS